jgi:predicted transcriptional regulator
MPEGENVSVFGDIRARDIMVTKPLAFTPDRRLLDAVRVLIDQRIPGAPVVDDQGNLVGALTEQTFLESVVVAGYHGEGGGRVGDHMNEEVQTVNVDASLFDIATLFIETGYRWFPVVDENRLVGVVARREVLRAIIDAFGRRRSGVR